MKLEVELDTSTAIAKVKPIPEPGQTYLQLAESNFNRLRPENAVTRLVTFATAQTRWFYEPSKSRSGYHRCTETVYFECFAKPHVYPAGEGFECPPGTGILWPVPVTAFPAKDPTEPGGMCLRAVKLALAVAGILKPTAAMLREQERKAQAIAKKRTEAEYKMAMKAWKVACEKARRTQAPLPTEPAKPPANPIPQPSDYPKLPPCIPAKGIALARNAGHFEGGIPEFGYVNVADQLHYCRHLAAPGDILIYEPAQGFMATVRPLKPLAVPAKPDPSQPATRIGTTQAPNIKVVYTGSTAAGGAGHIEIRTYDGMVSDYWHTGLGIHPTSRRAIGIWRREGCWDPWAIRRTVAFLRLLREWVQRDAPEGDPYHRLWEAPAHGAYQMPGKPLCCQNLDVHPWAVDGRVNKPGIQAPDGRPGIQASDRKPNTSAGAYGFTFLQWEEGFKAAECPPDFQPLTQDLLAVYMLQKATRGDGINKRTALACIREGGRDHFQQTMEILRDPGKFHICPATIMKFPAQWGLPGAPLEALWEKFQRYTQEAGDTL